MSTRLRRFLLIAAALLLISGGTMTVKTIQRHGGSGSNGNAGEIGKTGKSSTVGSTNGSEGKTGRGTPKAAQQTINGTPLPTAPPKDFAYARYPQDTPDDPRPSGCKLEPGNTCQIRFYGNYRLETQTQAMVIIGAYEDDKPEPVTTFKNPVPKGTGVIYGGLIYKIGDSAKFVRFKVTMVTRDGSVLFQPYFDPPALPIR